MGYKNVCTSCRVAFSEGTDLEQMNAQKSCPQCGEKMVLVNQKFKPPKKSDGKSWEIVKLLLENGIFFQSIWVSDPESGGYIETEYPKNLSEAKEFVKKYGNPHRKTKMAFYIRG